VDVGRTAGLKAKVAFSPPVGTIPASSSMALKQLVLAGSLLLGAAQAQTTTMYTISSAPGDAVRELLERVTGGGQAGPDVMLGGAPADLLKTLPAGSRVIGTVTYPGLPGRGSSSTTVYLDSPLLPSQVIESFAKTLGPTWKQADEPFSPVAAQGGFQPGTSTSAAIFYRMTPPQTLRVATQRVENVTQVSLNQQGGEDAERFISYLAAPPQRPPGIVALPKLRAPEGSTVNLTGSGNGEDSVTQTARIETKLSRQAVLTHYAAQLRQAGWTLTNQANAPTASSTIWTYKQGGRDRVGILIIAGTSPYAGTLISQSTR